MPCHAMQQYQAKPMLYLAICLPLPLAGAADSAMLVNVEMACICMDSPPGRKGNWPTLGRGLEVFYDPFLILLMQRRVWIYY